MPSLASADVRFRIIRIDAYESEHDVELENLQRAELEALLSELDELAYPIDDSPVSPMPSVSPLTPQQIADRLRRQLLGDEEEGDDEPTPEELASLFDELDAITADPTFDEFAAEVGKSLNSGIAQASAASPCETLVGQGVEDSPGTFANPSSGVLPVLKGIDLSDPYVLNIEELDAALASQDLVEPAPIVHAQTPARAPSSVQTILAAVNATKNREAAPLPADPSDDLLADVDIPTPSLTFTHGQTYTSPNSLVAITRRSLPRWRDLDERGVALAYHRALVADLEREVYAFSLEFSDRIRAKAIASGKFARYVAARVALELRKRLPGEPRDFVFVVEAKTSKADRPHIHGELAFKRVEAPIVGEALAAAGGKDWKPKRRGERQVDFSDFRRPDDFWLHSYGLKTARHTASVVPGRLVTGTENLRGQAKALFELWRVENLQGSCRNSKAGTEVKDKSALTYPVNNSLNFGTKTVEPQAGLNHKASENHAGACDREFPGSYQHSRRRLFRIRSQACKRCDGPWARAVIRRSSCKSRSCELGCLPGVELRRRGRAGSPRGPPRNFRQYDAVAADRPSRCRVAARKFPSRCTAF
ncbi:hypothetical protein [Aureimonas sp. D3]|uniref:hypothetical protein n=1 Tax=Aureimonas sp. D3 TaxID=1638164 RepID=UPI000A4E31A4|nr:hypothetical protein [Aureimonas sp. D3]